MSSGALHPRRCRPGQHAADGVEAADDHGQQVVEVVRDPAGELADGLHLLGLAQRLLGFRLIGQGSGDTLLEGGVQDLQVALPPGAAGRSPTGRPGTGGRCPSPPRLGSPGRRSTPRTLRRTCPARHGQRTNRRAPRRCATAPARRGSCGREDGPWACRNAARCGHTSGPGECQRTAPRPPPAKVGANTWVFRGMGKLEKASRGTPARV